MELRIGLGGVEMAYDDVGTGERPFVLLHGFTGSRDDFADVLPDLAPLGQTLAPDWRGHGASTNTGDASSYSLDQLVRDLRAFLDALAIERIDLLGHSMGGMAALRFALEYPERVRSLVLMDTSAAPLEVVPPWVVTVAGLVGRHLGMPRLYRAMRRRAERDPRRPPSVRRAEQEMGSERFWSRVERKVVAMDPVAFRAFGAHLRHHPPALHRLDEIARPTLVVVGEEDTPFLAPSRALAAGIPGAELRVIPDAAHSPQIENRPAWTEAVTGFLEKVRAAE